MAQVPQSADLVRDVARRRTFAIISHPDAGKTTLTEKLLLFGGAIQMAGTVKARKSARHATSDWMEVEKQRGISVTSSVMQFEYARPHDQPARHAGPRGFLRGHLPRADRGRRRGDGDRRRQGRRGADDQAARSLPAARHADHHVRQQDGPRSARAARAARGNRVGARRSTARRSAGRSAWASASAACSTCGSDRLLRFTPGEERAPATTASSSRASTIRGSTSCFPTRCAALRHDVDLIRGASSPFDLDEFLAGRQIAGVLRLRHQQLRRAGDPAGAGRVGAAAAAARRRHRASCSRPRAPFTRLRVQDPGEHGSAASRPHRVLPRVLGPLSRRR